MTTSLVYPKVLLVGRANVGKSTLFNRLTSDTKSIVYDFEGVTRDYVHELVNWNDKTFDLVDTGGILKDAAKHEIAKQVQESVFSLMEQAALVILVCDAKNGLAPDDARLAKLIHKTKKPSLLVLNKADSQSLFEQHKPDFFALGFKDILAVSAIHGSGIGNLLGTISSHVGQPEQTIETPQYKVAILGKPNVGKSSLMNLLLNYERSIVANVPGTTREAITEKVFCCNDLIDLTDTPGVRRSRSVNEPLESLMVKSALAAVRCTDLVLLMVDASAGSISDQELKLLFYAYEQRKMLILVCNKTDLLTPEMRDAFEESLEQYDFVIKKIPVLWISCVTQKNVMRIFNEITNVWRRCHQEFNSIEVNELIKEEMQTKPLTHTKIPLHIKKVRQIVAPVPTFILFVNFPEWFGPSQLSCVENILRGHYDLRGCPVHLIARKD